MNYYRVSFITKKGGYQHWLFDIPAGPAKFAKVDATGQWCDWKPDVHMFHVEVHRLKDTEEVLYNWFTKVDVVEWNKNSKNSYAEG